MTRLVVIHSIILLAVPLVLAQVLPGRPLRDRRLDRVDLVLTLLCGVGLAFVSWEYAGYYLVYSPVTSSDYHDYCSITAQIRDGVEVFCSPDRSRVAALLPGLLARKLGIANGLLVAALVSLGLTGCGLYVWGRALFGRLGGVASCVAAVGIAPLMLVGRMLTFYPEAIASVCIAAALTAWAAARPGALAVLAASIAIGLCLLTELRNIVWAIPFLVVVAVAAWRGIGNRPKAVGLILTPLVVSFLLGPLAYNEMASSLEQQVALARVNEATGSDQEKASRNPVLLELRQDLLGNPGRQYVWGRSSPVWIPRTIWTIVRMEVPLEPEAEWAVSAVRNAHVLPLVPALGLSAAAGVVALRRRPFLLFAAAGTAGPYLLALRASAYEMGHFRFISTSSPVMALLIGVAWAALANGEARARADAADPETPRLAFLRPLLATIVLAAFVSGAVPGILAYDASWRTIVSGNNGPDSAKELRRRLKGRGTPARVCVDGMQADRSKGLPDFPDLVDPARLHSLPEKVEDPTPTRRSGSASQGRTPSHGKAAPGH